SSRNRDFQPGQRTGRINARWGAACSPLDQWQDLHVVRGEEGRSKRHIRVQRLRGLADALDQSSRIEEEPDLLQLTLSFDAQLRSARDAKRVPYLKSVREHVRLRIRSRVENVRHQIMVMLRCASFLFSYT